MPTTETSVPDHSRVVRAGIALALVSSVAFGSSGPMAKALLDVGWSAGAAVLVRLSGAAVLLTVAAAVALRGTGWRLHRRSATALVIYGLVAMAGTQLAFFNAVRTLEVGVALLLEYLAPVLLLAWTSLRTRRLPGWPTLGGAALTMVGLAFVLELTGTGSLDPVGVAWGLVAAVCLAGYFALSARVDVDLPPVVLAAGGTAVGAVAVGLAGVVGIVPLSFTGGTTELAGSTVSVVVPALWLVVVATVVAYLTGIAAVVRLGARSASFLSLVEVLAAVLVAWVLLAELPGTWQLVGGVCIVTGIVLVQRGQGATMVPRRRVSSPTPAG
jgi:drug/metabolite transporter (DMT)-like permease